MSLTMPMSGPDLTHEEIDAVVRVLRTASLSIGPQVQVFEEAVARNVGAAHAVAVSSGTAGLHLCTIAAGVDQDDLVLTTPFSFISSANCVLYERGIPVFVDIDPQTLCLDPEQTAAAAADLTQGGTAAAHWLPPALRGAPAGHSLKALLPVDVFCQPADMDPLCQVARQHNLLVIEDSCEAIGAAYKGRPAGTLGDAGVFAFYPNKQMTTAEGGVIVTDREDWALLFRSLRNQGRDVFDAWLNHSRLGYNYRLDEMSAALGLAQLGRIEELLSKRDRVAHWYNERLQRVAGVHVPHIAPTTTRVSWFVYVIRLAPEVDRNRVMAELEKQGVPSRPYFSPIHLQPFYQQRFGYRPGDFPITEAVARSSLALPFSSVMEEEQVERVCAALTLSLG